MGGEVMAVAASHMSDRAQALVRTFRAAFAALDDHKSQAERDQVYAIVASHLRSASPMAMGAVDIIDPVSETTIPLADGARVDFVVDDGTLVMYVVEASGKDAAVPINAQRGEQVRRELARVLASGVR
jgi:hypothetical protein